MIAQTRLNKRTMIMTTREEIFTDRGENMAVYFWTKSFYFLHAREVVWAVAAKVRYTKLQGDIIWWRKIYFDSKFNPTSESPNPRQELKRKNGKQCWISQLIPYINGCIKRCVAARHLDKSARAVCWIYYA